MVDDVHVVGKGLVGQAALTGEHTWISSENFHGEAHHPKVASEIYQQFSAGMQIPENARFVDDVAMFLLQSGHVRSEDHREQELASRISAPTFPRLKSDSSAAGFFNYGAQTSSPFSSAGDISKGVSSYFPLLNSSTCFFDSRTIESQADLAALKLDHPCQSQLMNFLAKNSFMPMDSDVCAASLSNSLLDGSSRMQQKIETMDCRIDAMTMDDICSYPRAGDDLFDVLGAEFKNQVLRSFGDSHDGNGNCTDSPEMFPISQEESKSEISTQSQADYLLEAVVSKTHSAKPLPVLENSLNDGMIRFSDFVEEESLGIRGFHASSGEKKSSATMRTSSVKQDSKTGHCTFIYDSWIGRGLNLKRKNDATSGVGSKPGHKRVKSGENPKPRPRDRQMIQDRVKELREIVPNGAKCSIDSLLERTIKHMLFLQSVTNHAEKLKQAMESKIINNEGDLQGATYHCEARSKSMVCPILVEDLSLPGHILIEMLCHEQGFFLEIAHIIRNLGLTILRGIIETRKDDAWARFTVETNGDISRMEVSLTLISFLEQNTKRNNVANDAL